MSQLIRAYFRDGRSVIYTQAVFDLLKTDPDVRLIINAETGEILFSNYPH